jgi:NAD(P)-dependent dehydrogenase (short-subunit alcohol dehydrogenase family)
VNTICPGAIATSIDDNTEHRDLEALRARVKFPDGEVPLTRGRPGTADQVAELAWFLSSDLARHISGTEVFIDGAQSLLQG